MMMRWKLLGAAALLALAACTSGGKSPAQTTTTDTPAAETGPPRMRGKVVGPDRVGLHGVKVTTKPPTDAVLTYRGKFEIARVLETDSSIAPGKYELKFTKLGWNPRSVTVDYPGGVFEVPMIELGRPGGPAPSDLGLHDEESAQSGGQGASREGE